MKLLRYGPVGREKPGVLGEDGRIRDLSGYISDIDGEALASDSLARLKALDLATLPLAEDGFRLGCPVARVGKFIAVGLNYADHAAESNMAL
jgi:2-keto-4-pentenoate hydratase/2-oxohepta-3-ene-1,7-dioic acid hydratase in catechol pathway